MNPRQGNPTPLRLLGLAAFALLWAGCESTSPNRPHHQVFEVEGTQVNVRFAPGFWLSTNRVAAVVDVAKRSGISEPAEIETMQQGFTGEGLIRVKGRENVEGPLRTYLSGMVYYRPWVRRSQSPSSLAVVTPGLFATRMWMEPRDVYPNQEATLTVRGETFTVRLRDLSFGLVNRIINAFAAGDFACQGEFLRYQLGERKIMDHELWKPWRVVYLPHERTYKAWYGNEIHGEIAEFKIDGQAITIQRTGSYWVD